MLGLRRYYSHSKERLVAIETSQTILQHCLCFLHMLHHIIKAASHMNGQRCFALLRMAMMLGSWSIVLDHMILTVVTEGAE